MQNNDNNYDYFRKITSFSIEQKRNFKLKHFSKTYFTTLNFPWPGRGAMGGGGGTCQLPDFHSLLPDRAFFRQKAKLVG